jgi:hypothetical protein
MVCLAGPMPDARVAFFAYDFRQPIDTLAAELDTFVHNRCVCWGSVWLVYR